MAVLFPFEKNIYQQENIPATFVGHPLMQIVQPSMTKEAAYVYFRLDAQHPIIALLPGSRTGEIKRHLPIIVDAIKLISKKIPDAQFVLPLADTFHEFTVRAQVPSHVKVIKHHLYNLLQISDAAIAVSGTVTLETALMQVPLCIIYCFSRLNYLFAKWLIHVDHVGLCNIVAEKRVATEWIQQDATPHNIANEILHILTDHAYSEAMRAECGRIKNKLVNEENPASRVTDIAIKIIADNIIINAEIRKS